MEGAVNDLIEMKKSSCGFFFSDEIFRFLKAITSTTLFPLDLVDDINFLVIDKFNVEIGTRRKQTEATWRKKPTSIPIDLSSEILLSSIINFPMEDFNECV